ncbi:MAG: prepilin-type N-terminal cleavage/methylation domain-containing protein [Alphaproteobacteria bacterium]|nr:prepilin-type N-terminal cleavage/methylation domain-containing protein [Alphaproteobacteria bacterium]
MTKLRQQKGFTLVELAIVLVIIGLLIGGILKGQELMTNARATATVVQFKAVEAAMNTFLDSRGALPGDFDGNNQIPGCGNTPGSGPCSIPDATAHNGIIGDPNWPLTQGQYSGALAGGLEKYEPGLFWFYLAATGLLSGIDGTSLPADPAGPFFGKDLPETKFGGGMLVGNGDGAPTRYGSRAAAPGGNVTITGTLLSLVVDPVALNDIGTPGAMLLKPTVAAQIDRKADDGLPGGGAVQAFGNAGCVDNTNMVQSLYNEGNTSRDCGLYVGIGN